ncbi:MAG: hypothetical protein U5J98_03095 [Halobacteriales archaeon]|nr:hypothetical protein [Halobacteriales archaeon]
MEEIPVLTCPVCGRSAGFDPGALADPDALKDAAWAHLSAHRDLDEPKRAIYAVMMVERRERRGLPEDESLEEAAGEWAEEPPARPLA